MSDMAYRCPECDFSANKKSLLLQHQRTANHWRCYRCHICNTGFTRTAGLDRHMKKHDSAKNVRCQECGRAFGRSDNLTRHLREKHQIGGGTKRSTSDIDEGKVTKELKKNDDPHHFYTVTKIKEQKIEKFKTTASTYKVNFKDIEATEDIPSTIKRLFQSIFQDLTKGTKAEDLVRLVVQSSSLDYPIIVPFTQIPSLTPERFMTEIERVLQSNEDFMIDYTLLFEVTLVNMPNGGARKKCKYVNTEKFLAEKRCIIQIKNNDELCCARAVITAKAKLDQHEKWDSIRQGRGIQRKLALELHEKSGVAPGKCRIEEIKLFQKSLINYQINVISKDRFNGIIYSGPESDKKIYLYYHDNHYDVITSMSAFLSRSYYCTRCQKGYSNKEDHSCNNVCHCCRKIHKEVETDWIHCNECNRFFMGNECSDRHRHTTEKGNSTCRTIYRCQDCGKTVNKKMSKKSHSCGDKYCAVCKDFFAEGHQCYMLPEQARVDVNETENARTFIFFDFECRQDDQLECSSGYKPDENGKCRNCCKSICGSYEHKPNLCVAQKVCTVCMNRNEDCCKNCLKRQHCFSGDTTLDDFCTWLFSEENYDATVICHNFQGYDSYPILQYLYKNAVMPTVVPNGSKIMSLTVPSCKLKMIDSINFLPMALAKLPSMFGLDELKKGYFPHLFNRKGNQTLVMDHLPEMKYYGADMMKRNDREEFIKWYEIHKNDKFDLQKELLEYCKSDVDILRRCCLQFREDFINITRVDPFEKCITIASACHLVFRTNFLQPETIGLIPHHGYRPQQQQSVKALQWLKYLSQVQGIRIQHAQNGGEKAIGPYLVDGYYETETEKIVLEFHGDFWHGNPTMFSRATVNPVSQKTMGELYEMTLAKQKYLEDLGYTYQSIWESEFDKQVKENSEMRTFINQLRLVTPLEPRDAFYGGRTEAFTLYKEATRDEKINYYDVTSLYPWVNKTGKVPLGHPKIITENFKDVEVYEGIMKCKVQPPKGLFHPVLPARENGKLLFHLCKTCAETQNQNECQHTEEERAFVGTWVTDEIKKAIQMGYKILEIHEVWHFDNISKYDPNIQAGGIFREYVNTFLKLKQEASGWPAWCLTEKQKQQYINMYFKKEGIRLDYKNIRKNPGMRALAKLMLNSFWGKFGQRCNRTQVDFVEDPVVYFDKLTSDREEVTAVNYVSEEMVEMRWKYKEDFIEANPYTNVIIAAYTTAQARLKLYSYLENLGPRVLYADTDSVVFSTKYGQWKPSLGDYLGDLTDELPDDEIVTFVTGGPKNYAYQLAKADKSGSLTHCKIRGITLNYKNLMNVNFQVLRQFVTQEPQGKVAVVDSNKIVRNRDNMKLLTVSQNKDYRLVFDKRVVRENYVSFPYGY